MSFIFRKQIDEHENLSRIDQLLTEPLINNTSDQKKKIVNRPALNDISNTSLLDLVTQTRFVTPPPKRSLSLSARRRDKAVSRAPRKSRNISGETVEDCSTTDGKTKKPASLSGERRNEQTPAPELDSLLNVSSDLYSNSLQITEDSTAIFDNTEFVRNWDSVSQSDITPDHGENAASTFDFPETSENVDIVRPRMIKVVAQVISDFNGVNDAIEQPMLVNAVGDVISDFNEVLEHMDADNTIQECVEETLIEVDENLPANQQNFSQDLLLEMRKEMRVISDNVKSICDCVHIIMTNSEQQGSIGRINHERLGTILEKLDNQMKILQTSHREKQLTVNLLSNINNAVTDGRK